MSPSRRRDRADKRRRFENQNVEDRRQEAPLDLEIRTKVKEGNLLVWINNAMLAQNCFPLRDEIFSSLNGAEVGRVILNMEGVPYADTTAIGLLVDIHKKMKSRDIIFILFRVRERVNEVLNILQLDKILDIRNR